MMRRTITVTSAMTGRQRTVRVRPRGTFARFNEATGMFGCVPFLPGHGLVVAMAQHDHDQAQRAKALDGRVSCAEASAGMQRLAERLAGDTPTDTRRLAELLTRAGVTVGHDR